jgi:hypothetical protein
MANSKVTKKEMFAVVRGIVAASDYEKKDDALAFIDHEVGLLAKKSAKSGQTKTQKSNLALMDTVKAVLAESDSPMSVAELMKDVRLATYIDGDEVKEMSNQKLSSILTKLGNKGTNEVVKTYEKKKPYFSLNTPVEADGEEAEEA